jgi:glutaredoxin
MITIYTKTTCPKCVQMKKVLETRGIDFMEVNIEKNDTARTFLISEGHKSVPQLYAEGKHIDTTVQQLMYLTEEEIRRLA